MEKKGYQYNRLLSKEALNYMYEGNEHFSVNGNELSLTMTDFWRWAYSDLLNNIPRSVLAEYIVASSLGITRLETESTRQMWRPYDLLTKEGTRVEVKSSAYVQAWDSKHPDCISFRIAPARLPDETGDYKISAPKQRNSDVYVFAIYKAMTKDESPLNLDLWEFYVISTKVLNEKKPTQKTITLPSLMLLEPFWCDYHGIGDAIKNALNA